MPNLIIFIDGFPYRYLEKTGFLESLTYKKPMRPGFGLSVNLKPELFAGLSADQVGFFCEWGYNGRDRDISPLWTLLAPFRRWPYIDRAFHRVLGKVLRKAEGIANIPFDYLKYFSWIGRSVYSPDFGHPTLFTAGDLRLVLADAEPGYAPYRDEAAYYKTRRLISQGESNIFVSFVDLDAVAHKFGLCSSEYADMLRKVDLWSQTLIQEFGARWPEADIVVLSDHGMSETHHGVRIELEKNVGKAGKDRYLYFLDLTLLRVWVFDEGLRSEIEDYLRDFGEGRLITSEERVEFGITSKQWGDFIFVLNDNRVFAPNFLGLKPTKAMHSYYPTLSSQQGILLYQGEEVEAFKGVVRARDFFKFGLRLLGIER